MRGEVELQVTQRAAYASPRLERLGAFERETQGMHSGPKTDAYFPVGTPHANVTFS